MIDEKIVLAKLRSTLRLIASESGIESHMWEYVMAIDQMTETGKCDIADSADELIDKCVAVLEQYVEDNKHAG